jgi:hypothetical protein
MKLRFILSIIVIFSISLSAVNAQNKEYTEETLNMETGYANDLFYSMSDGLVASVERAGWDIAFYTSAFSAGIIINEGNGVMLYNYPNGDTTNWATVDTSGMSAWTSLVNSPEMWEDGAFNRDATGHPDYGWGVYNQVTHSLTGAKIYVINVPNVGMKKLWIVDKISVDNIYHIRYANIDGSYEQNIEIDVKPYTDKNFIYFSLETNQLVDREPTENWDLLFTKYFDLTQDMAGNWTNYLVTGATSNVNRATSKYYPVAADYNDWSAKPMDSLKNTIGYNWKSFSMNSFSWEVEDSTAFFVKNEAGDVYKLIFTQWEGTSTGVFALTKEMVSAAFISDFETTSNLSVYPNPALDNINIVSGISFNGELVISDISGRILYSQQVNANANSPISFDIADLNKGLYILTIDSEDFKEATKFIVR